MFFRKIKERGHAVPVPLQRFDCFPLILFVTRFELIAFLFAFGPALREMHLAQQLLRYWLVTLRQGIDHVEEFLIPATLFPAFRVEVPTPTRCPGAHRPQGLLATSSLAMSDPGSIAFHDSLLSRAPLSQANSIFRPSVRTPLRTSSAAL